ncbi:DUF2138 family protein [Andreprevotia chitinilytica]|uniref:DUF2138 family protein n=1 Tax=Andreprevotia chitinilytica TaxID=396808 RepID=UPI001470661E|nr:DUF2138 family protein [Andreprevotia chitinilytica]
MLNKKKWIAAATLLAVAGAGGLWWHWRPHALPPKLDTPIVSLPSDLTAPDAVIATPSLAELPRALLAVPFAKKVLTEDMVDYYEHHPDKLALEGSLRRIAFEHELTLQDRLLQHLLDKPAELALWKSPDGKLRHWVIRMQRDGLDAMLGWVAKAAASDRQLSEDGTLRVGSDTVPLYKVAYGADETLWFAAHGQQLLVLSDKDMLAGDHLGPAKKWTGVFGKLLADGSNPLLQHYGIQAAQEGHAMVLGARYLSFGYQQLFPSLRAVRLDVNQSSWFTHVLIAGPTAGQTQWNAAPLLAAAPEGAALCLSAPVEWSKLAKTSEAADVKAGWLKQLEPAAAICWYADTSLYSPLLLARTHDPQGFAKHAATLFDWLIGVREAGVDTDERKLPVRRSDKNGVLLLQRAVSADDGELPVTSEAHKQAFGRVERYFDVSMAQAGPSIVFSPSAKLVETALSVQAKSWPALADKLDHDAALQGYIAPAALSALLEKATVATLPGKQESLLRQAAVNYLLPHVKALGEFDPVALSLAPSSDKRQDQHWEQLQWRSAK